MELVLNCKSYQELFLVCLQRRKWNETQQHIYDKLCYEPLVKGLEERLQHV